MTDRKSRLYVIALALIAAGPAPGDDDLSAELPRIKATEPADAASTFRVRPGFRLDPIAVEPAVADPVAAAFDADGRLYVVEMRGYPYPEQVPTGNVRRLDDRDGDGKYETSTIFLDGLSWPTAVVPSDGGVFIAAAPEIIFAKDTDGDGRADLRRVAFSGFGTQNVQALVNGLCWGPDGWIYGAGGPNGGEIKNHARPDAKPVSVRGRDFRFRPDGSALEAISGGGQFGHGFDDWGHRFVCSNSNHIRQIVLPSHDLERNPALAAGRVVADIAVEGAAGPVFRISPIEPWRIVRTRQRVADPAMRDRLAPTERVAGGFFTSATGVTIYRGTAFPPEYRGNAFIGDVGGNLVHRKTIAKAGSKFRATRADQGVEFIASTDNWFRPVNFANTPDGTLLVLDMYRETIEHPASIPEPIKKHLDLTSGHDRGRIFNLVPNAFQPRDQPRLASAPTTTLVTRLADPDAWWRETAQRLLIERRDPDALPALRALASARPSALARVHALNTIAVLDALHPDEALAALADPDPNVREQAARLAEPLAKVDAKVAAALLALAEDPDAMVRFQSAFSIGEVASPEAIAALASIADRDAGDVWSRVAVLSSVAGRPGSLAEALSAKPGFFDGKDGPAWTAAIGELVGGEGRPDEVDAWLARFAAEGTPPGRARSAILGLARGLERSGGSLRGVADGRFGSQFAAIVDRAAGVAAGDGSLEARIEAVGLLRLGPADRVLETLPPLLDAREPAGLQLAAIRALTALPDSRVGPAIIERWRSLSPTLRREALEALFARPERIVALLDALDAGTIAVTDLDADRRRRLLASTDPTVRDRATMRLGTEVRVDRAALIAGRRGALAIAGDRDQGRLVFQKACATCHRAGGVGVEVGPDLATVAGRTPDDLLVHILDPNREVAPPSVNYAVATVDGRIFTGLIFDESAVGLTLKRAEGATDIIPRARIEEITSSGLSLMPEGLEMGLEDRDLADLIAFIRGLTLGGR